MPIPVSTILGRAVNLLQDKEYIQWTKDELIEWLNEAVERVIGLRPDANAVVEDIALVAGARQSIPADATQLLRLDRNKNGPGVLQLKRADIDDFDPDWIIATAAATVSEWTFDRDTPRFFWVSPPNDGTGVVEAIVAKIPDAVGESEDSVGLPASFTGPLVDYIIFRALDKNTEQGMKQLAKGYWALFLQGLGMKHEVREETAPSDEVED